MESRKPYLATLPGLILGCLVCCALWGSAFPCIKIGYALFGIPTHDSASQLLFAGLRFTLAGALVIVGMSAAQRRPLVPQARDIKPIFILSLFQTIGQYFFFYLGLSRASAMSSSIIEASANFLAILFAALAFRTEKLDAAKVLGCVLGFTGVALVNLSGADGTFGFTLDGEGFILASTVAGGLSGMLMLIGAFDLPHRHLLARARRRFACRVAVLGRRPGPHRHRLFDGWRALPHGNRPRHRAHRLYGAYLRGRLLAVVASACRQPRQPRLGLWVYEPSFWRVAERAAARRGRWHEPCHRNRGPALSLRRHHHCQQT